MTTGTQATATAIVAGSAWRDSADHGDIEQDQARRRDSAQPEPFGPARAVDSHPRNARDQRQQRGRYRVANGLGGEQGCIAQDDRDGHTSANERHCEDSQNQSLCELARLGRTWHGSTLLQRWTNEQVH